MDNQRMLIWATFGILAWLTYQAWQADYARAPVEQAPQTAEEAGTPPDGITSLPSLPDATEDTPQLAEPMPALDKVPAPSQRVGTGIVRDDGCFRGRAQHHWRDLAARGDSQLSR